MMLVMMKNLSQVAVVCTLFLVVSVSLPLATGASSIVRLGKIGVTKSRQPIRTAAAATRYRGGGVSTSSDNNVVGGDSGPPGNPNVIIYPGNGWGLSKPVPKASLYEVGMEDTAKPWILNLIEFVHWASFPIGFYLVWIIFQNNIVLGKAIASATGNASRGMEAIAAMMLAHLCQVFGGGISGNMMHQYEGWQVSIFRNPLAPYTNTTTGVVEQEPVYNNAWLRAVAYQMLFAFQTLGVLLTAIASFGTSSSGMQFLVALTFAVIILFPQLPHCTTVLPKVMKAVKLGWLWKWITKDRPVFPLSIYVFVVFLINSTVAWNAYGSMFGPLNWTKNSGLLGRFLNLLPQGLQAAFPFLLVALGGMIEGLVAETSFNQWAHFVGFLFLDTGLALHIPYYLKLVASK